jgi:hypothetical protein
MKCTYLQGLECKLPHVENGYYPVPRDLTEYCYNHEKWQDCPRLEQYYEYKELEATNQKTPVVANIVNSNNLNNVNSNILNFNSTVSQTFNQAYHIVDAKQLSLEEKDEINGRLLQLENELKKEAKVRDKSKIQRLSEWLKRNAKDIFVTIEPLIVQVLTKHVFI